MGWVTNDKMLKDLAIAIRDGKDLNQLIDDIVDAKGTDDDYGYTPNQLLFYLSTLS